jgi:aquaporin Z
VSAPAGFAPIAIGLGLTLIRPISIPVTNTSVNPARSTGVAFFAGGWAVRQLWLFWIVPILGAALAGITYREPFGKADTVGIIKPRGPPRQHDVVVYQDPLLPFQAF